MTTSSLFQRGRFGVFLLLALTLTLSACGFKLRGSDGSYNLPFNKLWINLPVSSPLAIDLKRNIRAIGSTQIVEVETEADGILEVLTTPAAARSKSILSLNTNGRVSQYLLAYNVRFRVRDQQGNELLAPTTISLSRAQDFDDAQLLAKQREEDLLYQDMQRDLVQQILRRMSVIKPVVTSSPAVLKEAVPDASSGTAAPGGMLAPNATPVPAARP